MPVVAVALLLLLSGCSLFGSDDAEPKAKATTGPLPAVAWETAKPSAVKAGGTLRLAVDVLPANFNPEHASNGETDISRLLSPTVGSAVRVTADGGWQVDPDYARSVKIVDRDPLKVQVKLNRDAVWQGGTPITAADMIAYAKAHDGSNKKLQLSSTRGFDDIASVKAGDDQFEYTVTFSEPITDWPRFVYPELPANVSKSAKLFNSGFTARSISSNGPFVVTSLDRKRGRVVMEPNPRWWGHQPKLKKIIWQAATPDVQLKALAAGELDLIEVSSSIQADAAKTDLGDAELQVTAGTEWTQLTMNGARGALRDVKVRRAIALALDRTALARLSTQAVKAQPAVLGSFIYLPGQAGYTDQSARIAHDATAARQLLAEAGWSTDKPLKLVMPVPADTATSRARAELIAKQLKQVGIEVTLQTVPDAKYFSDRIIPLDFDLATFTWTGSAFPIVDAEALFYPIDSGQNFTGVEDDELAGAWKKGIVALDDAERFRVVKVLDKRLFRDVPIVPLGVVPQVSAVRSDVVNIGATQFQQPDWTRVGFRAEK